MDWCRSLDDAAPNLIRPHNKTTFRMPYEYRIIRRVEFSETDMAGIMHYSNFYRFMETAEHAFFRSLGFSIVTSMTDPPVGWPRVHARCDFRRPLHFEDEVEVVLLVKEKRSKSITYQFRFYKLSEENRPEVAIGEITVVCVQRHSDGSMKAVAIPSGISKLIDEAPIELLGTMQ